MNGTMAAVTMAFTVGFTGALVEWIARAKHPRRLFFLALGRERTAADDARARRLRIGNAVVTLLAVAMVFAPVPEVIRVGAVVVAPLVSTAWLSIASVATIRSSTLPREPGRFVVSLEDPPPVSDFVSMPLQVANVLVVLVPMALAAYLASQLPQAIPAHWDAAGRIDRYGSPSELWMLAGIMVFDLGLLWLITWTTARERWVLPERDAERYASLAAERRSLLVRLIEWIMLAVNASMGMIWIAILAGALPGWGGLVMPMISVSVVGMTVGIFAPMGVYIPRLIKVADGIRAIAGTEVLGTRASGWIWGGTIYYAPEDPAVFVSKRVGIGQTVNFARPMAWVFLVSVIAIPILISLAAVALG